MKLLFRLRLGIFCDDVPSDLCLLLGLVDDGNLNNVLTLLFESSALFVVVSLGKLSCGVCGLSGVRTR